MIEENENLLRCREHFRENIQLFKDAFIRYYGEERREEIEEKFSRAIFLAYRNPESTNHYLRNLTRIISNEIIEREMKTIDTNLKDVDLFGTYHFDTENLFPIYNYREFFEQYQMGREGRIAKYKDESFEQLKSFLPELQREEYEEMIRTQTIPSKYDNIRSWLRDNMKYAIDLENADRKLLKHYKEIKDVLQKIDPDINMDNFSYYLDNPEIQNLNMMAEKLESMTREYQERMAKYQPYQEMSNYQNALKSNLQTKYYLKFIEENIDLVPEAEKEGYEKFKRNPERSLELGSYTRYIFGYGLQSNHPLEAFTTASCQTLENNDVSSWKKEAIERDRIEYFKRNGIDLGNDYEAYQESEEAKKIWPTEERANYFTDSRQRLLNEFNIEYYSNTPEHLAARREIEEKGFLDKDDSFNASLYTQTGQTFVNPNITETEDGMKIFSIVAICCDNESGHIDHDIIHELNHLFELTLKKVKGNTYEAICGWDSIEGTMRQDSASKIDTLKKDRSKRQYELFSEIINELIAQEICEEFAKTNSHVFDTDKNATTKNTTSYEKTFFLVRDFFKEFKKEIIESRANDNIEVIWNHVGKENFDALNELFHIFIKNFDGFKFYSLMQSIQNKEDNEQTRIYFDLIQKRDEILDKMRKHSMLHEETDKKGRNKKESTK